MDRKSKENSIDKKEKRKEIIWKITAIVLYFIFLCCLLFSYFSTPWKKYGKSADNELTIDRIMDCVRKEGYYPEKLDDDAIQFKIQGIGYKIFYGKSVILSVYIMLQIPHDDIQLFKEISWDIAQKHFLLRPVVRCYEHEDLIELCINSLTTSYSDFSRFLPTYIEAIKDALDMTRNLYNQRKSDNQQPQKPETAFMNYMPKNIKS